MRIFEKKYFFEDKKNQKNKKKNPELPTEQFPDRAAGSETSSNVLV